MEESNLDIKALTERAVQNIRDTVTIALEHTPDHKVLVVYDTDYELTSILTDAYRAVLPEAAFINFNKHSKEEIIAAFDGLSPRDMVVLIQSMDFRLNDFRIRIYLFQKKLKVIDHLHLSRNTPDSWGTYIDAIAYDPKWYRVMGHSLKTRLGSCEELTITCGNTELRVDGGVEVPKLNIGDYTGMENIGGTFPIGEVFTEARDLTKVNGSLMIYAFAGTDFNIRFHEPFRIDIKDGLIVEWSENTPESFVDVVEQVKGNERPILREIGFGLNRAITREHYVKDITAFERILGMHVSLGEKHTIYKKQGITPDKTRFHVDLFLDVTKVQADKKIIYENSQYLV